MKRIILMITILAAILYLGDFAAMAQRGQGGGAGGHGGPSSPGKMDHPGDKGMKPTKNHDTVGTSHESHDMKVGDRLAHNRALSSKLQALLPTGTSLQDASAGFKNLGQFAAAVHVSHNLNIPFEQLKAKMTGKPSMSLGKAIHEFTPSVKAKEEVKKADKEAAQDIKESKAELKGTEKHAKADMDESKSVARKQEKERK